MSGEGVLWRSFGAGGVEDVKIEEEMLRKIFFKEQNIIFFSYYSLRIHFSKKK